jgi:hypothetical protein
LEVNPLPPSDVIIHLLLSETIFSPLPLWMAEISSVGGVWTFSGTTHYRDAQLFVARQLALPNRASKIKCLLARHGIHLPRASVKLHL